MAADFPNPLRAHVIRAINDLDEEQFLSMVVTLAPYVRERGGYVEQTRLATLDTVCREYLARDSRVVERRVVERVVDADDPHGHTP
jgi:hypothetical protein